jgi:hypothetical protein
MSRFVVPVGGVAPPFRVYESLVLTLELHRQYQTHYQIYSLLTNEGADTARARDGSLRIDILISLQTL